MDTKPRLLCLFTAIRDPELNRHEAASSLSLYCYQGPGAKWTRSRVFSVFLVFPAIRGPGLSEGSFGEPTVVMVLVRLCNKLYKNDEETPTRPATKFVRYKR